AMASLDSNIPPSTDCSAVMSCGGCRSKACPPACSPRSNRTPRSSTSATPGSLPNPPCARMHRTLVLPDYTDRLGEQGPEPVPPDASAEAMGGLRRRAKLIKRRLGTGCGRHPGQMSIPADAWTDNWGEPEESLPRIGYFSW